MNTIVNFEIATLLKQKKFSNKIFIENYYNSSGKLFRDMKAHTFDSDVHIQAPTIADVVMWIYEKHGIWTSRSIRASD